MKFEEKPPKGYTKKDWQRDFAIMKKQTKLATGFKQMPVIADRREKDHTYYGKTQYQCYCSFINDILKTIRDGEEDFCYAFYHVEDLLRFERDRLKAEWLPEYECFSISLENKRQVAN